jgi:hypothetical protein
MENIKTFEDACKVLNLDPEKILPDVSFVPQQHQAAITAATKLFIIANALNGGWKPDWNNLDQHKWFPWFDMEKGFRLCSVGYYYGLSSVGSRLCFRSKEIAKYAANQFLDLYKEFFTL